MVVLTAGVTATIITAGAAAPIALPAAVGATTGTVSAVAASGGTAAAVAGSAGAGAVSGAIAGATVGCTATAAEVGAVVGAGSAAAVTSSSAGAAGVTAGVAAGPVGWIILGVSKPATSACTYDCWKPVVHDTSPEPSSGKLLREIMMDPRVKQVIKTDDDSDYPEIILENIWDEKFKIEYVLLPSDQLAAHAVLLSQ